MSETGKGAVNSLDALIEVWKDKDGILSKDAFVGVARAWLDHVLSNNDLFHGYTQAIEGLQDWYNNSTVNEENFWIIREARRLYNERFDVNYKRPDCWREIKDLKPQLRYHFLHASTDDPLMVAFTPNHSYGKADRQVRTKLGKYLMTFYGDVLSEAQIKAIVAGNACVDIKWGITRDDFSHVYINGPDSCMAGEDDFSCGDTHPTEAYASGEFKIAYVERKVIGSEDMCITARSVVHEPSKTFVRLYGNDADRLEAALKKAGYTKESRYPDGAKLLKITYRKGVILPFIDGNARYVKDKGNHFELSGSSGDYYCDNTSGFFSKTDYRTCDCCGDEYDEDDEEFTETHSGEMICSNCFEEYYCRAYYGANHHRTTVLNRNLCVECESNNEFYRNMAQVLKFHRIERCEFDHRYWHEDDMVTLRDGERCSEHYALVVGTDKDENPIWDIPENLTVDYFVDVQTMTWYSWSDGEKTAPCIVQFLAPDLLDLKDKLPSSIISVADAINMDVPLKHEWQHRDAVYSNFLRLKNDLASAMKAMKANAA